MCVSQGRGGGVGIGRLFKGTLVLLYVYHKDLDDW